MGGGNFVVPAQCVTDFLDNRLLGIEFIDDVFFIYAYIES